MDQIVSRARFVVVRNNQTEILVGTDTLRFKKISEIDSEPIKMYYSERLAKSSYKHIILSVGDKMQYDDVEVVKVHEHITRWSYAAHNWIFPEKQVKEETTEFDPLL